MLFFASSVTYTRQALYIVREFVPKFNSGKVFFTFWLRPKFIFLRKFSIVDHFNIFFGEDLNFWRKCDERSKFRFWPKFWFFDQIEITTTGTYMYPCKYCSLKRENYGSSTIFFSRSQQILANIFDKYARVQLVQYIMTLLTKWNSAKNLFV